MSCSSACQTHQERSSEPSLVGNSLQRKSGCAQHLIASGECSACKQKHETALQRFAESHGVTLLHVAVAGLAAQRCVASVIVGATSTAQVEANADAISWEPSAEDLAEIDRITARARPGGSD